MKKRPKRMTRIQRDKWRKHSTNPPTKLPDFDESLRVLIEDEQYTLEDVGMMFDVSRERARQWCARRAIRGPTGGKGLLAVRQWDDTKHRFVPMSRSVVTANREAARREQARNARYERQTERQHQIIAAVAGLRAKVGREPTWREMWCAIGGDPTVKQTLCAPLTLSRWDSTSRDLPSKLKAFRKATGTTARDRGRPGHVT